MDDFVLGGRDEARARLTDIGRFLETRLALGLNPSRVVVAPLSTPRDFLGYVHHPDGRIRVRRRSVRRLWRRLATLEGRRVPWRSARASVASWLGLAKHAHAFRLSRSIFAARDVRNIGTRLLVGRVAEVPRLTANCASNRSST